MSGYGGTLVLCFGADMEVQRAGLLHDLVYEYEAFAMEGISENM